MKHLLSLMVFALIFSQIYAQQGRYDGQLQGNHSKADAAKMQERKQQAAAVKGEIYTPPHVYVAIDLRQVDGQKGMRIDVDKGDFALGSLLEGMPTPVLDQLSKGELPLNSSIDLINYLSERDWEIMQIMPAQAGADKGTTVTRIYVRKPFSHGE